MHRDNCDAKTCTSQGTKVDRGEAVRILQSPTVDRLVYYTTPDEMYLCDVHLSYLRDHL